MSVSFFPSVPYPDKIGVNMSYSSFGEVRQIVAGLIDKAFANLIKESYGERLPSDFYTRYAERKAHGFSRWMMKTVAN